MPTDRGWHTTRFTEQQLQLYGANGGYRQRSLCWSGAMLDMVTDSYTIEFEYTVGDNMVRNWLFFDIFLDGLFVDTIGTEEIQSKEGTFRYVIPSDDSGGRTARRVTIYFPHLVELSISDIRLSEGADASPAPSAERNLLSLGDSITQGFDALHPSCSYPVLLSRFLGMNLLNQGIGGYVFNKESLDPALPYRPDLITVAYGTNDWNKFGTLAEIQQRCGEYIHALAEQFLQVDIVVITPIWRKDGLDLKPSGSFHEVRSVIRTTCVQVPNVTVIDGWGLVPQQTRYFGDGRLHPNDEGFLHMTMNLLKQLPDRLNR